MVGRPERPLDPDEGPLQQLAFALRKLRTEAGSPTYREMAARTGSGASTLAQAASGERLPSLPTLVAYVQACGGDVARWEERWREVAETAVARPRPDEGSIVPPYRGLARYEPDDRDLFFGRAVLVAQLVEAVRAHRVSAVVGASGSGKSSLLRAGLVPALRTDGAPAQRPSAMRIFTPGARPFATHAALLQPEAGVGETVVLIDQFEELFTLGADSTERDGFLDLLLTACAPDGRLRVVIAVRADFFGRCAEHAGLAAALRHSTVLVGPMNPAELREAVVRPAAAAGLIVARDLTEKIVDDTSGEPGGLPLMSHALLETWRRRRGRALTLEMYRAAGGLDGAIAKTAEDVHANLTPQQADLARSILLRLVAPGDGGPDTRRPTSRSELDALADPGHSSIVIERLAGARLLTLDDDTVLLAHEALITSWPRLRRWVEENRERLRVHRRLTEAARSWAELGKDSGALYRGTRLTTAEETFTSDISARAELTALERDFLDTSIATHEHEQHRIARTARRLRRLTVGLSLLLVVALVAAGTAYHERRSALDAQKASLSRQLAAQSMALRTTNFDLSGLLAVQAYRTSLTTEARAALYAAGANPLRRTVRVREQYLVAVSADGRTLATVGGGPGSPVHLRDATTGHTTRTMVGPGNVFWAAFSPDGRTLGVASSGVVQLWDTRTGRMRGSLTLDDFPESSVALMMFTSGNRALALDSSGRIWDVAAHHFVTRVHGFTPAGSWSWISPDGGGLVTVDDGGTVHRWDLTDNHHAWRSVRLDRFNALGSEAYSPDGRRLAVADREGTVRAWDLSTGRIVTTFTSHTDRNAAIAFSPDGRTLAVSASDHTIQVRDVATGRIRDTLTGHTDTVASMAFGPDGRSLATISAGDGTLRLWWVRTPTQKSVPVPRGEQATATALSPDARKLAVASGDPMPGTRAGTVRLWDLATGHSRAASSASLVDVLTISPDGRTLAEHAVSSSQTRLLDVASQRTMTHVPVPLSKDAVFSPDGGTLAVIDASGDVGLWETATGRLRGRLAQPARNVASMAFSPDGETLAVSDLDTTQLWDVHTRRVTATLSLPTGPNAIRAWSMAYSPRGHTLATAGGSGAHLWNTTTGHITVTFHGTVTSMAFSPNAQTLATTGADGSVVLRDTRTGSIRATLTGDAPVIAMAFSPDGHTLTTTHSDQTLAVWNTDLADPDTTLDHVCQAIGRNLTPSEQSLYVPDHAPHPACPTPDRSPARSASGGSGRPVTAGNVSHRLGPAR